MTLTPTPELEQRLADEARRRGVTVEEYALEVLERAIPGEQSRAELIGLLRSWSAGPEEGDEAGAEVDLCRAIDEDRLSDRKLFPPELRGVTW